MLTLRDFEPADDAALISWLPTADAVLWWTGPMLTFPLDSAQLDTVRNLPGIREWTAYDETGARVGHVGLALPGPTVARVVRVIVDPELRGRGLGRQLMVAVMEQARGLGVTTLTLNVVAENHRAIGLYRSLGFEDSGVHPDRDDMRVMTRTL